MKKRTLSAAAISAAIMSMVNTALAATPTPVPVNPFETMTSPIVALLDQVLGPAIALVGALGTVYCVLLGVKLAKAEEQQDREKAKASLKNAIIGFLLIFVLVVALKVGLEPLASWMNSFSTK